MEPVELNYIPSELKVEIASKYIGVRHETTVWQIDDDYFILLKSTNGIDCWWSLFHSGESEPVGYYLVEGSNEDDGEGTDDLFFHLSDEVRISILYTQGVNKEHINYLLNTDTSSSN